MWTCRKIRRVAILFTQSAFWKIAKKNESMILSYARKMRQQKINITPERIFTMGEAYKLEIKGDSESPFNRMLGYEFLFYIFALLTSVS